MSTLQEYMLMAAYGGPEALLVQPQNAAAIRNGRLLKLVYPWLTEDCIGGSSLGNLLYAQTNPLSPSDFNKYTLTTFQATLAGTQSHGPGTKRASGQGTLPINESFRPDGLRYLFIPTGAAQVLIYEPVFGGADVLRQTLSVTAANAATSELIDVSWSADGNFFILHFVPLVGGPSSISVFKRQGDGSYAETDAPTLAGSQATAVGRTKFALNPSGTKLYYRVGMDAGGPSGVSYQLRSMDVVDGVLNQGTIVSTAYMQQYVNDTVRISSDGFFFFSTGTIFRINLPGSPTVAFTDTSLGTSQPSGLSYDGHIHAYKNNASGNLTRLVVRNGTTWSAPIAPAMPSVVPANTLCFLPSAYSL